MSARPPTSPDGNGDRSTIAKPSPAHSVDQSGRPTYRLRYQELFDLAPDAQVVTDLNGVIFGANLAAAALFGYSKEFLIGKPLGLLFNQASRRRFYQCLVNLQAGHSDEFESLINFRSNGTEAVVQAIATDRSPFDAGSVRWQFQNITRRKRAERELMMRLVTSQENERRRISREIHDHFGQELTALSFGLRDLESDIPEGTPGRRRLRALKEAVDRLGRQAHELAFELRPAALDDLGLKAALEGLIQRWSEDVGIPVGFHFASDGENRAASEAELALYRIIQEALTNIAKHASASSVSVIIEQGRSHLMALVEDNGRGFDAQTQGHGSGLGLLGMSERLSVVGGSLEVESRPGAGTTIRARIPCRIPAEAGSHV